jgi:hypothetical protein
MRGSKMSTNLTNTNDMQILTDENSPRLKCSKVIKNNSVVKIQIGSRRQSAKPISTTNALLSMYTRNTSTERQREASAK